MTLEAYFSYPVQSGNDSHRFLNTLRSFRLLLLTGCLGLFAFESQAQYKPWSSSSPLIWSDFQGTPPPPATDPEENHDAYVYTEILWDFTWDESARSLEVNAQAVFVHPASWYRPAAASASLLTHEIGHFDYAEVSARQLKQRIAESTQLKDLLRRCDVTEAEIEAILTQYHAEEIEQLEFYHEFYDSEADHGQNLTQQDLFTNTTIPNLMNELSSYSDPLVTVTVENEGAVPVAGNYQGVLKYTLKTGATGLPLTLWTWELQGRWNFSLTTTDTGGISHWTHEYIDNQFDGHLLDVTLPAVTPLQNIPVEIQQNSNGAHYWIDGSVVQSVPMPSHQMTMAPVSAGPVPLPTLPDNTIVDFPSAGPLALGTWMKVEGTPALKMRAPVTCPNESIVHTLDMGHGQFFELEWTLTRVSPQQDSTTTGGAGGHGSTSAVDIMCIVPDHSSGNVTLTWEAHSAGQNYLIEYSEDLHNWTSLATESSTSAGTLEYTDTSAILSSSTRFYRISITAP